MMNKCLVVVDMQNDFIDGALGFEWAKKVIEPIKQKIKDYRRENQCIVFTQDTHSKNYQNTVEGEHLPIPHCIEGTKGHKLHEEIEALRKDEDKTFQKETFPALSLGKFLKNQNFSHIELCGLVSDMCVLSNAVIAKSALPNANIHIDARATTTFDLDNHEKALDILENLHIEIKNRSQ